MLLQNLSPQIAYLIHQTDFVHFLRAFGIFCSRFFVSLSVHFYYFFYFDAVWLTKLAVHELSTAL